MMDLRVAIVFTSPNINEYHDIWKGPSQDKKSRVISQGGESNWFVHVHNGQDISYHDVNGWKYDEVAKTINNIMQKYDGARFAVFFHASDREANCLRNKLGSGFNWPIISYSSQRGSCYEHGIKPFRNESNVESFNKLWGFVERQQIENKLRNCESLRYQILSPLVALDLLKQAGNSDKSIRESIRSAWGTINQEALVTKLCKEIGDDELRAEIFGLAPESNWGTDSEKYHKDLCDIAQRLEDIFTRMYDELRNKQ